MCQPPLKNTQVKSIFWVSIETTCSSTSSVRNKRNCNNTSLKKTSQLKRLQKTIWHLQGVHRRVWGAAPTTRRKPCRCLSGSAPHSLPRSRKRSIPTCTLHHSMPMNIHCGRVYKSFSPSNGSLFITIKREHKEISSSLKYLENSHPRLRSSNRVHYRWYSMF